MTYRFGPYMVSSEERVLFLNGFPVAIPPKAVDLLIALLARSGRIVSKSDLLEGVWPSDYVDEANLTQHIYLLRRFFAQHGNSVKIENVRTRGYRLVIERAPITDVPAARKLRSSWWFACCVTLVFAALLSIAISRRDADPNRNQGLSAQILTAYMLGRADLESGGARRLQRAAQRFAWVIRFAPQSALGYAALAECDVSLSYYASDSANAVALQAAAITLARRAVTLDAYSAEAYASLGVVAMSIQHDDAGARMALDRALKLDPRLLDALLWKAILSQREGRLAASHRLFMRAVAVAPDVAGATASLAWNDFLMHDYAGAIAFSRQLLRAGELASIARVTLANAYLATRDYPAARPLIGELEADPATRVQGATLAARLEALRGRTPEAASTLHQLDESLDPREAGDWDAASIAAAYAAVGERERAYVWLTRVHFWERREVSLDPGFASLVHDARFTTWLTE